MDSRIPISATLGVAFVFLLIAMFIPTVSGEETGTIPGMNSPWFQGSDSSFEMTWDFTVWESTYTMNGGSTATSWFDDEMEGDGIGAIRAGAILLSIGLGAVLAAVMLAWIPAMQKVMLWVLVGAAIVIVTAAICHTAGIDSAHDGTDPAWAAGLFLLWTGVTAAIAAAVIPGIQTLIRINQTTTA